MTEQEPIEISDIENQLDEAEEKSRLLELEAEALAEEALNSVRIVVRESEKQEE